MLEEANQLVFLIIVFEKYFFLQKKTCQSFMSLIRRSDSLDHLVFTISSSMFFLLKGESD